MHQHIAFFHFAHTLADTARSVLSRHMARSIDFATKDDMSPVTVVDQAIERALRDRINEAYPDHGILGEEYATENPDAEYTWVIDPIDGTKAFITGIPVFGTLIALTRRGEPFLGIIDHPVTNERWVGREGMVTTYNGQPVTTRKGRTLDEAIVSIGNPESLNGSERAAFAALRGRTKWGIYGGNCYAYGRLAMGRIDISVDGGLDPFDYCALDVIVRGAGGCMSDWEGNRLSTRSGQRVVASGSGELHREVIALLRDC